MLNTIKTRCRNTSDTVLSRLTQLFCMLEIIGEDLFDYLADTDTPFIDPDLVPDLKKIGMLENRDYEEKELRKILHDLNADTLKLFYTVGRIGLDEILGPDHYCLQFNCLLNDPYAYNKALYDVSVAYIDANGKIALYAQPIEFHLYEKCLCASEEDEY